MSNLDETLPNKFHELDFVLKKYNINKEDVCIVGSSILSINKIRENNDIDIIIKKKIRDKLFDQKQAIKLSENVELVSEGWFPQKRIDDDEIISNCKYHDYFSGFKVIKIELLYIKKKYSNRTKDKSDFILLNEKLPSLDVNNELIKMIDINFQQKVKRKFKKILNYFITNSTFFFSKFGWLKYSECLGKDLLLVQDTSKLLAKQVRNGKFNRYDVIVRYLAIEEYYNKHNFGFDLYNKMQKMRINQKGDSTERIKSLVQSIEKFDFCNQFPIIVDKNQQLEDGSHRFASILYFNNDIVPLRMLRTKRYINYGIEWFEKNDFSENELKVILNKKDEIFVQKGIYFPIILWPPVKKYFYEIEKKIETEYRVVKALDYYFRDKFDNFVVDVYDVDDIEMWKINKKIEGMETYSKYIRVLYIEIPDPRYRKKAINNNDISREVENIKKTYRNEYKTRMDNYFYDIIMHIGDNYYHNRYINRILDKYKEYKLNGY